MNEIISYGTLHRTAKYFMDNGQAATHDAAMDLLRGFGLSIGVGPDIAGSIDRQVALLTLVNVARRTFLGGVEVVGVPADVAAVVPLTKAGNLRDAITALGGSLVPQESGRWPTAVIGDANPEPTAFPCWRLTWEGWRGGVVPLREGRRLADTSCLPLAPALAAASCAAETFAFHANDHLMAGRRAVGLSLWSPGRDWLEHDSEEPALAYLPTRVWLIGLGNLGQAFAWLLASLPYACRSEVQFMLQDYDTVTVSNDSTSILSSLDLVGQKKTRMLAGWLEARGFSTMLDERRFGEWTRRAPEEPGVALCGVDNALARTALEKAGFDLIVEAGLGAAPQAFRSFSMHTFPGPRPSEKIWAHQIGQSELDVSNMPAYEALRSSGIDHCGIAQLASRTVGVPFVGLIAATLVVGELLRRLHGGPAIELVSGSIAALADVDISSSHYHTYPGAFQAVPAGA